MNKTAIMLFMLLLSVVILFTGYRYFVYMNEDPGFCLICHVTEEGYRSWERSEHHLITCQECHSMSLLEGNKLLLTYYVGGKTEVESPHGRKRPWEACQSCHGREAAQGSLTFRESFGHARHVFMREIGCRQCHTYREHLFDPESENCRSCHEDKLVHGMGTAGLSCLNCHSFTEEGPDMTSSKRCFACHTGIPTSGVMSNIQCHECHHPHQKLKIESSECLGRCHSGEARVGQHGLHLEKANLSCLDCHRPHAWEVKKDNAPGLCDRCHPLKDPMTFIY